jgi:hypothetical protein
MSLYFNVKNKRLFYLDKRIKYTHVDGKIFKHNNEDIRFEYLFNLPVHTRLEFLSYKNNLISRLLRNGLHHLAPLSTNIYAFIYNKRVCVVENNDIVLDQQILGSRPLSFEKIGDKILFGEYRSNPERSGVSVFSIERNDIFSIKKLYTFNGIRHIHGIYQDPFSDIIYITTGDEDSEAAIYKTDDFFKSIERVIYGSQQTRTIKLLFDEEYIYFGSDAPHEKNYLYKLNKRNNNITRLTSVGSSVFHGCKINNWFFFSTAIEPSKVNKTKYAEVWASPDGNNWKCILRFKKDILPMRYFQYGQIFFPNGPGDGENLWISPFATKYSNKCISIDIKEVRRLYDL